MKKTTRFIVFLFAICFLAISDVAVSQTYLDRLFGNDSVDEASAKLVALLKKGGVYIYFRHTAKGNSPTAKLCLSSEGRSDAEAIGIKIAQLKLRIEEVYASPTCRTIQSAILSFPHIKPIVFDALAHRPFENADIVKKELLATPTGGGNIVLWSHGGEWLEHLDIPQLEQGDAAVITPVPRQKAYKVEGVLPIAYWRTLEVKI